MPYLSCEKVSMYREENIFKEVPRRLFFSLLNGYEKRTRMSEGEETNLFVKREIKEEYTDVAQDHSTK